MKSKREYWCSRCMEYCKRRRSTKQDGDIQTLWETITHKSDGSKESFCYGKINTATNQILEMRLI